MTSELDPYRSSKDKHKWCKGKVGVLHDYEWHQWAKLKGWNISVKGYIDGFWIQVCNNCGRHGKFENRNSLTDATYYRA